MDLVKVNTATIADYNWDLLDRRQQLDHMTTTVNRTSYQFDIANQLTSIENALLPSTIISRFNYTLYDNVGNRKSLDVRRGTNFRPPYRVGQKAQRALNLPPHNPGTAFRRVNINPGESISGPRTPRPRPELGHNSPGTGQEYYRGPNFPD